MLDAAGALYFPWVLPYGIAVIVIAIIYIPWLLQLPLYTRIHFFISGTLFLSGALGLEILSATFADQYGLDSAQYTWTYTAEETLEMLGIALFIRALIHYLSSHTEEISIVFSAETKQEA
jgi:hypothetical protein